LPEISNFPGGPSARSLRMPDNKTGANNRLIDPMQLHSNVMRRIRKKSAKQL
jgi:hypothetical protein